MDHTNQPSRAMHRSRHRPPATAVYAIRLYLCALLCGCTNYVEFTEVKQLDEKVSSAEFDSFLSIIDSLPEKKLPDWPRTLLPRPHWKQERTLPIQDLVRQEKAALDERWQVPWVARQIPKNKILQRALRREHMTREQFVGLSLTIGAALTADALDSEADLEQIVIRGKKMIQLLEENENAFSSLSDEEAHEVLTQAAWLTVVNRAERLMAVPPENIALVRKHRKALVEIFPDDLQHDPFVDLTHVLEELGIPFEEMPESGTDEHITWNEQDAIFDRID